MPKSQKSRLKPKINQLIMEQNSATNPLAGLHKQKMYCLIGAGIALIAIFLPWMVAKGGYGYNVNGLKSWGLISLLGVIGVIAACFMSDKSKPFEGQTRQIALGSFGAIALGALLFLLRILTAGAVSRYFSPGLGLFLALIVGVVGLLFLMGKVKIPDSKPKI
jgi:hypothetical protein